MDKILERHSLIRGRAFATFLIIIEKALAGRMLFGPVQLYFERPLEKFKKPKENTIKTTADGHL